MAFLRKRGKIWYVYWYQGRKLIGRRVSAQKEIAERFKRRKEYELDTRRAFGIIERISFKEFSQKYLEFSKTTKSQASSSRDELSIKHLLQFFFSYDLTDIRPQNIERYRQERLKYVSKATTNRELACLKHLFTKAIDWGYAEMNPVKRVKFFKEAGKLRYLNRDEIKRLLEATQKSQVKDYMLPIISIALNTGLRKKDIFNLTYQDINLKTKTINLTISKTSKPTILPINSTLYEVLKKYIAHHKNEGKLFKINSIKSAFTTILKKAGIENCTFHTLRHTFGSQLVIAGVDVRVIQELLGLKSIVMVTRYTHPNEISKDTVEKIAKITKY